MTKPSSHVKLWSMKKHKKILTCISLKRYLRGVGMNNYWNHEPEFFGTKKNSEKVRNFWLRGQTPPSFESIFWKNSWRHFLRTLMHVSNLKAPRPSPGQQIRSLQMLKMPSKSDESSNLKGMTGKPILFLAGGSNEGLKLLPTPMSS